MRVSLRLISCLAVATAASVSSADTILRQRTLADLTKASTTVFDRQNCDFTGVSTDSGGNPVATLKFRGTYAYFGQDFDSAQDWSAYNMVRAKLKNNGSQSVTFRFIVQLSSDPDNYTNAYTGALTLGPNETKRFIFTLNVDDPSPFGMEYLRPVLTDSYSEVICGSKPRDLSHVYRWRVSLQDSTTASVSISELKLLRQNLVFNDMVDKYGQYTDRGWADKIHEDTDFAAKKAAEMTDNSAHPGPGEQNGSKTLVNPSPTLGKWKVVRNSSGRKYLQHPNGKLFWSVGVSAVTEGAATPVEGRESMFESLPSQSGSYAAAYLDRPTPDGTLRCLSFNMKNLMTKYGSNYQSSWQSMVKSRLASWGINTLGIQCDDAFIRGSVPYTMVITTQGFKTRLRTPYMLWGTMPDPYTSGFQTWMASSFADALSQDLPKTNFMGVFVDNEISWGDMTSDSRHYNIPRGVLNASSSQPAKAAFQDMLQSKYSTISALNSAWKTSYTSWDNFLSKQWLPTSYTTAMKSDFSNFLKAFADKYYSKVDAALIDAGLKSLYLGSRYDDYTPEVVSAATKYVDVVSFNIYRTVENVDWDYLNSLSKPVLISELGYGTKSRGTFGGPATAFSFQERAERLQAFLEKARDIDNIIGVHWYCYNDQPITGRWSDYENTGMGLVDVTDTPYPETVQVLRDFTKSLYAQRG